MIKLIIPVLIFLAFLFAACNQAQQKHEHSDEIELNEGSKWKVVPEMLGIIRAMESDVNSFTDTSDFNAFSIALSANVDSLTTNCTMKGKAQDELHKWLLPFIDLVNEAKNGETKEEQVLLLDKLKASFETFNQYFE